MRKNAINRFTEKTNKFFVGRYIPFVCSFSHHARPFVCRFKPSVSFINNFRGFTLVELVMVIVVVGLLAALAIPNMSHMIESNRLITHANDMLADISVARSEAIKQSKQTGICTLVSGSSPPTCNTTANWGTGWVVFIDEDNNGAWSTGDKVVRAHESVSTNMTVTPTTSLLLINKLGSRPAGSANFVITVCNTKLKKTRVITTTVTGRPSITEGAC